MLGMNSVPSSSGLTVGVNDHDGAAGIELAHGIVGVGQAKSKLARPHRGGDLFVAREDLHAIGLQVAKVGLGLVVAPGDEQAGRLGRRRAEERLGDADLPLPARFEQVLDPLRPVGLADQLGVDQQDAGPGREAIPGSILGPEGRGQFIGVRQDETARAIPSP